jgi:tetratricopeptide (TPR) repeat protein
MALKIAVYMITKGEHTLLERALASAKQADWIIVGNTSDDGDVERVVQQANPKDKTYVFSYPIRIMPWRFDHARNAVLAMVPDDVDVCVSLDSDEVLAPNWREEIEKHWTPEATIMSYMFDWSKGIKFRQAKFHKRSGYHWVSPCHEVLTWYAQGKEVVVMSDEQLITHLPDDNKPRSSYLQLLHMGHVEQPHNPRMALYYGRELLFYKKYDMGAEVLHKFLDMPDIDIREASYAWRIIGKMKGSEEAFLKSIQLGPLFRDPYVWYAAWLYEQGRYNECLAQVETALKITERTAHYFVDPSSWDGYPKHLMSWCYWHLGDKKTAQELALEALELEPDNVHYKNCLEKFIRD